MKKARQKSPGMNKRNITHSKIYRFFAFMISLQIREICKTIEQQDVKDIENDH